MARISKFLENIFIPTLSIHSQSFEVFDLNENKSLHRRWLDSFSTSLKHKILWHAFSFNENSKYYEKETAISKFNKIKKRTLYIFSELDVKPLRFNILISNDEINYLNIHECISKSKPKNDIYITDEQFTWTFVITHEKEFGPYFALKS